MENSNLTKQAKSDIFSELYPIINFYINKGATAQALKKYYRNSKRFNDILEDIKNKGANIITDDTEYKNLAKSVLNDIFNDLIAKEKDDVYKNKQMKHIKEFNSYEYKGESFGLITSFAIGFFLYKFLKSILTANKIKRIRSKTSEFNKLVVLNILDELRKLDKIPIIDLNDRFFMRFSINSIDFSLRLLKDSKVLNVSYTSNGGDTSGEMILSDDQYNDFLKIINK